MKTKFKMSSLTHINSPTQITEIWLQRKGLRGTRNLKCFEGKPITELRVCVCVNSDAYALHQPSRVAESTSKNSALK